MLKIAIVGCESVGKTTILKKISKYFDEPFVIEFGKWYCLNKLKEGYMKKNKILTTKKDFKRIVEIQKKINKKIEKKVKNIFFQDTDFIFTKYFYLKQFNDSEWIDKEIIKQNIDYYIFIKRKNIFLRKDTIINKDNIQIETFKLLKLYKFFFSKKLFIIENEDQGFILNKIIKFINAKKKIKN